MKAAGWSQTDIAAFLSLRGLMGEDKGDRRWRMDASQLNSLIRQAKLSHRDLASIADVTEKTITYWSRGYCQPTHLASRGLLHVFLERIIRQGGEADLPGGIVGDYQRQRTKRR